MQPPSRVRLARLTGRAALPSIALAFALTLVDASPPAGAGPKRGPDLEKRIDGLLKRMTLDEKLDYLGGVDKFYIRANARLHLPALRMADGPLGIRNVGPSTGYAAGIALAASFDTDLAGRVGAMIGRDARARGVHFLLGPAVNIYRAPMCGRNFEYFGEDPFLASRIAVAYIDGVQDQGVSATVKHFIANNSEFDRHHANAEIDERTMREIYLPAFEAAVKEAHVGAIMSAYNLVNGVHLTQHDYLNNQVVKKEWAFDGIIMSDWDATYDGVAAANAGLDVEMPSAKFMNRATLLPAIQQGKVSLATIDDKVRRILRKAIQLGWLDREQTDLSWPLYSAESRRVALEGARAGMVLLQNQGDLLPLDRTKIKSVAIIGPDAFPALPAGGGSAQVRPFAPVSFLQGLTTALTEGGPAARISYSRGVPTLAEIFDSTSFVTSPNDGKPGLTGEYFSDPSLNGHAALTRVDEHVNFAWDAPTVWPTGATPKSSARWTGFFIPPKDGDYRFVAFTYGLDQYRLYLDGKLIFDRSSQMQPISVKSVTLEEGRAYAVRFDYVHGDHHARVGLGVRRADQIIDPAAKTLAARADVAIVLAGFDPVTESEGYDRTFQLPLGQDDLINVVRTANKNTIVTLTSGGGVDMTKWIDRVPAVVETWYAGQEAGTALGELLVGEFNPSGKLPATFERRWEDSAVFHSYYPATPAGDKADKKVVYSEGVFVGYRHFDQTGRKPLFPFGHGLSYTKFKLGALAVSPETLEGDGPITVAFDVTNVGHRDGAEVVQVYVGDKHAPVARPPKELKGFVKVSLKPGESKRAQVTLNRRAFSYYDAAAKQWTAAPGEFEILVGTSSQEIALRGRVQLHGN